ncbi:hypothetical protein I41_21510 [Lacipirellula limnantheis]|uniref:Uncharacterized protein n=1 Tax=Lacipirellula limnantheis TaxID=2528024 RepID=A0A517TX71_9BACT|nr:hypothetical protein I41_21510 [Lacipirellula limnantheis]
MTDLLSTPINRRIFHRPTSHPTHSTPLCCFIGSPPPYSQQGNADRGRLAASLAWKASVAGQNGGRPIERLRRLADDGRGVLAMRFLIASRPFINRKPGE